MNISVAIFSGSLRKESYTTKLAKAFQALVPEGVTTQLVDISQLPFLNQDLEADLPQTVKDLHATIHAADAIILATPEYNRSYSAVLKNALDWGSRPAGQNAWNAKPVGVVGCTPYKLGAFGAQYHLRQVLTYLNMYTLQQPEFFLGGAAEKFDEQGLLTDAETREHIEKFWTALLNWTAKVS